MVLSSPSSPPFISLFAMQVVLSMGDWFVDGNIFMKSGVRIEGR